MRTFKTRFLAAAPAVVAAAWLWMPTEALAVPAYARQTSMNCNSCHIGTDNVPNFTHTGRLFAMKGYTRPYVRERLRHDGDLAEDDPQYGGNYLALNWDDFFSARLVSELAQGGQSASGAGLPTTTRPLARMALFYTGAITDWLGFWSEIGYLGNNALNSVTTGQEGPTGVNFFAYDEYRLAASWDIGTQSFFGMSFGNEHPNVVGQFNFPVVLPDMWYFGQGGAGRSKDIGALSLHSLLAGKVWLQFAGVSGGDNNNLGNGWNQYLNVAYNLVGRTRNDIWLIGEIYTGNDFPSIMTVRRDSFICTGACPVGVTDSNLSITNAAGFTAQVITGAPVETVKDFFSYKLSAQQAVADLGAHTWYAGVTLHGMQQDFESGGEVERTILGGSFRYFWHRTYGLEVYARDNLTYEYTTPAGLTRDTTSDPFYGLTLLWNPAMNFSTHVLYNPKVQNTVFSDDPATPHLSEGSAFNVGFEYNF
jgi:hypothetical protein